MRLSLILIASLFLYILIPSVFTPALFLGVLAIYIFARKHIVFLIWFIIIVITLSFTSLTPWWEVALYYSLWSVGVYLASIFLDKSWAVQSIIATIWLMFCKFIITGLALDYMYIISYILVNGIGIAIFLYFAEKIKIYE